MILKSFNKIRILFDLTEFINRFLSVFDTDRFNEVVQDTVINAVRVEKHCEIFSESC